MEKLSPTLPVTAQIQRPDGEEPGQPSLATIAAACRSGARCVMLLWAQGQGLPT